MAKKAATKTTDQYIHTSSRRLNLPTEQTATTMSDADRQPILYKPETREIDHDPILAWNRRPADTDGHAAHPLYVREKVHPAAVVKLLEGTGEQPQLFSDFNGLPSPSRCLRVVPALCQLVEPSDTRRVSPCDGVSAGSREHGWQSSDDLF